MSVGPEAAEARRQLAETARAMLAGSLSFIEGARRINELRWVAKLPDFDSDITPFVLIDSETDALPMGEVRRHWAQEALINLQPEIDRAEQWAQDFGRTACEKLIDRFGEPSAG